MTAPVDIASALADPNLLGQSFPRLDTWETWLAVLKAAFGRPLNRKERRAFEAVSGGRKSPQRRVRELWCLIGRRGGKSRIAAALAVYIAALCDHAGKLSHGEVGMVLVLAASRQQAQTVFRYALGILEASPLLAEQIDAVTSDEIRLKSGIVIGVHSNSFRTVRGRTLIACVFDEVAYWRDETSVAPDIESYRAVLPALVTTDGLLVGISSPHRKTGLLHARHRDFFGKNNEDVLVVQGASLQFNPTLDEGVIARAREADPEAALSEWDGGFRSDLSALLDEQLIEDAIDRDRPLELPPRSSVRYVAFVDTSAGRHDAFCICIGHLDGERVIVDVVRGRKPPFDPASIAREYAELAQYYHCNTVVGDAFSGEWVARAFEVCGVGYRQSEHPKSALYLEGLPTFARGLVSIPDHAPLLRELRLLERRVARSGRDAVDHPVGGSDDNSNVVFGAMWLLTSDRRPSLVRQSDMTAADGAAYPLPLKAMYVVAFLVVDARGAAAVVYGAAGFPGQGPDLYIADFDVGPMGGGLFASIATRLDELRLQCRLIGCPAVWVHAQLLVHAEAAGLWAHEIPADFKAEERLLSVAGHVAAGRVKICAPALEKARSSPLAGALDFRAGEGVVEDSLRNAPVTLISLSLDSERGRMVA